MFISLDIESFGKPPNGALASLGLYVSHGEEEKDPDLNRMFHVAVDAGTTNMEFYASTIYWWLSQSEFSRNALKTNLKPVKKAFEEIREFVKFWVKGNNNWTVWAHNFDFEIVNSCYRINGVKCPWHYKQQRDLRTLVDISGLKKFHKSGSEEEHHAGYDAFNQARDIVSAFEIINGRNRVGSSPEERIKAMSDRSAKNRENTVDKSLSRIVSNL